MVKPPMDWREDLHTVIIQPSEFDPPLDDLTEGRDEELGSGNYGTVFFARCRGTKVAVKILTRNKKRDLTEELISEVAILSRYNHRHIVQCLGICVQDHIYAIVFDYCSGGDLSALLARDRELPPDIRLSMFKRLGIAIQIAEGMNWLHRCEPPVIHRDIAPKNILLDGDCVKICDFGLSEVHKANQGDDTPGRFGRGTPLFAAPEILLKKSYDLKSDIYSFGVTLWCLFTSGVPYENQNLSSVDSFCEGVVNGTLRPQFPSSFVDERLQDLIERCWDSSMDTRPTFDTIIDELKNVLWTEYVIEDESGRAFWQSSFGDQHEMHYTVPWYEFWRAWEDNLHPPLPSPRLCTPEKLSRASVRQLLRLETTSLAASRIVRTEQERRFKTRDPKALREKVQRAAVAEERFEHCLRQLLCTDVKRAEGGAHHEVFFSDFNLLFKRFGALFATDKQQQVVKLLQQSWFHGSINQQQAAATLGDEPGMFLVRFSSEPGQFTFSFVDNNECVMNVRFQKWPTKEMATAFLKSKGLNAIPHPGPTPYSHLFAKATHSARNAYIN